MRPDDILLLDMLLAARDGVAFLHNCSQGTFDLDPMRQLAMAQHPGEIRDKLMHGQEAVAGG